jgi:N-acyl-phosphatidylethanolamine-hydrolysing phospholipase D
MHRNVAMSRVLRRAAVSLPATKAATRTSSSTAAAAAVSGADFVRCTHDGKVFHSPYGDPHRIPSKGPLTVLRQAVWRKLFAQQRKFEADVSSVLAPVPVVRSKMFVTERPHCTWIGHSTVVFQTDGLTFVTDPIFSQACSPVPMFGPFRVVKPAAEVEELDAIDVVLLSHTHYDHLDLPSARRIGNRALWVVPLGVKALLRAEGITNCVELDWWQTHTISCRGAQHAGKTVDIMFTPAKHWTARGLFDRNTMLWGSFAVLAPSSKFFFAGDTAYCDVFKTIGDHFGPFDLATIPIGAYKPRWFLKEVHCDPAEALQIHKDLRAKQSCAVHWGTFPLADEHVVEPALELARARAEINVPTQEFYTMAHGETLFVGEAPAHDFATKRPELLQQYLRYHAHDMHEEKKIGGGEEVVPT